VDFFGICSTLIDARTLPGKLALACCKQQTEGLKVGCGWVGRGMGLRWSVGKGGVKGLSSRGEVREKVKGGGKDLSSRAEVREKVRGV